MSLSIYKLLWTTSIVGGVFAWALAGRELIANPALETQLNPMGINGSPYGEVVAMAMQGPIQANFDGAMIRGGIANEVKNETSGIPESNGAADEDPISMLKNGYVSFLSSLGKVAEVRTNPKTPSQAHRRYLRRQAENKLRFAYQLDPSHYANYNSLHFFLTEPQVGTRPELTPSAAKLADQTIQYCLKQEMDPRPALTAAAAATNILQLMFDDKRTGGNNYTTVQMRQYLNLLDYCIGRYVRISLEWDKSKNWDLLSPQRISECDDRFQFIRKIRDACEKTIVRIEGSSPSTATTQ